MGRRRRKPKAKKHQQHNTSTKELSADVVWFHILPRLPAKSLYRFRFVSKQWHSFITNPKFAHMHLHHQNQNQNQNHHKLLLLLSGTTFRTIDCENPKKDIDFVISYPFKGLTYDRENIVVASLDGMVCLRTIKYPLMPFDSYNLILWNPVTGEYKRLSEAGFPERGHLNSRYGPLIGLYYTSSDNDYKLLFVSCYTNPKVYIYSLKSDSWRKVDYLLTEVDFQFRLAIFHTLDWRRCTTALLNENLYFLVQTGYFESLSYSIISFDINTEKLRQIATPGNIVNCFPGNIVESLSILVVRGCIHLCVNIANNSHFELWRMDGDGDGDGDWTKVLVSSFPKDQEPLHLMRNENWLMLLERDHSLCQVDIKKHTKQKLCSLTNLTTIVEYIETLVSPNQ